MKSFWYSRLGMWFADLVAWASYEARMDRCTPLFGVPWREDRQRVKPPRPKLFGQWWERFPID